MSALRKGQNTGLDAECVVVTVDPPGPLFALLVDEERRARSSAHLLTGDHVEGVGVRCSPAGLEINTRVVAPTVHAVLCLVACEPGSVPTATVRDAQGAALATFTATDLGTERVVVLVEVYRRGASWKVRAVGQGYDGGLPAAAADHGITLDDPIAVHSALDAPDVLRRVRGIWEDAARSTAAYVSACTFAEDRREREVAATLADPARRTDAAADADRTAAHARHDELVARAEGEHERDMAQLVAEVAALEQALPAPVAAWTAPAWGGWSGPVRSVGVLRLGSVHADLAPQLVLPLVTALPLAVPLWVDGVPAEAAPVLRALVLRLLAAHPPGSLTVQVVDLVGGLDLGLPNRELAPVLAELLHQVDLARMAAQAGQPPPGEHLLVLHGLPHGLGEETLHQLRELVASGGVQVVVSGDGADLLGRHTDRALAALAEGMQRLPVTHDGTVPDPWTGGEWCFTPDPGPGAERVTALLRAVTATT